MDDTIPQLRAEEVRVLGCLIEKQITTPEYYPLSLNALVNACNQLTNRDPVVSYDDQTVVRALDGLRDKRLATLFHGAESRVAKYRHALGEVLPLTPAEVALLCVLMLRGSQTLGELRSRTERLFTFDNLPEVEAALGGLADRLPPLVAKLARQPGAKEARYTHLLSGLAESAPTEKPAPAGDAVPAAGATAQPDRGAALEQEVAALRRELDELKTQFAEFRKQFE